MDDDCLIVTEGLSKSYKRTRALESLSMAIRRREVFRLAGTQWLGENHDDSALGRSAETVRRKGVGRRVRLLAREPRRPSPRFLPSGRVAALRIDDRPGHARVAQRAA